MSKIPKLYSGNIFCLLRMRNLTDKFPDLPIGYIGVKKNSMCKLSVIHFGSNRFCTFCIYNETHSYLSFGNTEIYRKQHYFPFL